MSYSFLSATQFLSGTFGAQYTEPFSFCCWIKKADWTTANGIPLILVNDIEDLTPGVGFTTRLTADSMSMGSINAAGSGDAAQIDFAPGTFDGVWTCLVGAVASDTDRSMWMPGGLNANNTTSIDIGAALDVIQIGGLGGDEIGGLAAEAAIWQGIDLGADRRDLLFRGVRPKWIAPSNLICYYPMDKDEAPRDAGPNTLGPSPLTINGGALYSTDHPVMSDLNPYAHVQAQRNRRHTGRYV